MLPPSDASFILGLKHPVVNRTEIISAGTKLWRSSVVWIVPFGACASLHSIPSCKASLPPRSASILGRKSLCHGNLEVDSAAGFLHLTVRYTRVVQFGQQTLRMPGSRCVPWQLATEAMLDNLPAAQPSDVSLLSFVSGHGAISCFDYYSFAAKVNVVLSLTGFLHRSIVASFSP